MYASVLSSGSSGNCVYVEDGGRAVLVDCGLTVPELQRRLFAIGRDLQSIDGVLITHDHGDHVGSSVALARKMGVPLHATAGTHSILKRLPEGLGRVVRAGDVVDVGPFEVLPVATPHDGIESVCFRLTARSSGRAMAVATDLGYVPQSLTERLAGVHALVVELNHDRRMLAEGPYPAMLKARIGGARGHLSNEDGALLSRRLLHDGLGTVVLAHLSETNNTPALAMRAFERGNLDAPSTLRVMVAEQRRPSPVFEV